jgi:hypothetical protein
MVLVASQGHTGGEIVLSELKLRLDVQYISLYPNLFKHASHRTYLHLESQDMIDENPLLQRENTSPGMIPDQAITDE